MFCHLGYVHARRRIAVLVALTMLLLRAVSASAQTPRTGTLSGTVRDSTGVPVEDVQIVASHEGLLTRRATTDARGVFRITTLIPGRYDLTLQRLGYHLTIMRSVVVAADSVNQLAIVMRRRPLNLPGIISRADARVAEQTAGESGTTRLTAEELKQLPVGTDLSRAVNVAPGSRQGAFWGASGTAANSYQLDGVAINNPGIGGAFLEPSLRWVELLEIKGLGADAQQGNFQGGVINLITKSGSNTRHGSVEFSGESASLNGSNLTSTTLVPEIAGRRQLIGELSGPIVRDHLYFYLGAEHLKGDYRMLDHLSADTSAFAPFQQQRTDLKLFGKLTFTPSERDLLNVSVARNDQHIAHADFTGRETIDATTDFHAPTTVVDAAWQRMLGKSTLLDVKVLGFDGAEHRVPAAGSEVPGIYTYQLTTSRYYQNSAFTTDRHARSLGGTLALDRYTTLLGVPNHVRVGVEHADATWTDKRTRNGGMTWRPRYSYIDHSADTFVASDPLTWQTFTPTTWGGQVDLATHTVNSAAYIQDEIQLGLFTLFPGARLGTWRGDLDPTTRGVSTRTTVVSDHAWDPRIGLTFELGDENASSKITAHFGRYHQSTFAELFDRAQGANAYDDQEVWEYSGPKFSDPKRVITLAERNALAAQGQFRQIETVSLSQSGPVVNYRQPYVNQYVAGAELRPDPHWRGEIIFIARDNRNLVALVDRNRATNYRSFDFVRVYDRFGKPVPDQYGRDLVLPTIYVRNDAIARLIELKKTSPGIVFPPGVTAADSALKFTPDYVLTNPPEADRRFRQWQLTLDARFPRWSGSISGAFTGLQGNFSSLTGYDDLAIGGFEGITGRGAGPYVNPNESINYYGDLDNTSFLTLKAHMIGDIGWNFRAGIVGEYISGDNRTTSFIVVPSAFQFRVGGVELHPLLTQPSSRQRIYTAQQGSYRNPGRYTFDLHLEREMQLMSATWLLQADAFNVLGARDITRLNDLLSSDADPNSLTKFGAPLARQAPRQLRLGGAIRW